MDIKLTADSIPQDILESIYALVGWRHSVIVIGGRILIVDGEYTFANAMDSTSQHQISAKDVTTFIIDHKNYLVTGKMEEQFQTYLDAAIRRVYRYNKYTNFAQFMKD
tara:strand:- start:47606 stop:47929 length:324 start_codon:yes stop_codon:yes gene_type:complete